MDSIIEQIVLPSSSGVMAAGIIHRALRTVEMYRDRSLSIHGANVARICDVLARALGLNERFRRLLKTAAELHDVGKLAISERLLNKPTALSVDETAVMQLHCEFGADILAGSADEGLDLAADVALSHHENFDGSGYPRGLKGEAIPLAGRIIAICDVYDALRSRRPYRPALSHATATGIISGSEGQSMRRRFDPTVIDTFLRCAGVVAMLYPST